MPDQGGPAFVIHAGFHKTGTTSMQDCLRRNADLLAPLWRVETTQGSADLRRVTAAARAFSLSGAAEDLALVRARAVLWLAGLTGPGVLVSSEDLAGHMPGIGPVRHYGALVPILSALTETIQRFHAGRARIAVLLTTRAPGAWLRSLHWQQAKGDRLTLDFPEFAASLPLAADHGAIADDLRRALGPVPVTLAPLETLAARPLGPASALLGLADLPEVMARALIPVAPANTGPSSDLAAEFVALNRLGLDSAALRAAKVLLRGQTPARNPA